MLAKIYSEFDIVLEVLIGADKGVNLACGPNNRRCYRV